MVHINSDALPHHEYFEEATKAITEGYLGSEESNTSDDDGHRECGLGGYENCPDNPARYSTSREEDSFEDNKSESGNAGTTK